MYSTYWDCLKTKFLDNKRILVLVILTTVLCFGFTVCNYSIGVDDPARNHYLYSSLVGSMIQQGRLLHVLVNGLTGIVDFIPFLNDFLGAALFGFSALLFCALLQYITKGKLRDFSCIAFCCIYISYSITNEKFIYQLDVVVTMLSYCLTALGLVYSYQYAQEKKLSLFFKSVGCLVLAFGSYETFVFLYFCGVFAIFILEIVINKKSLTIKEIILEGLKYALILITAMTLYYSIVCIVQLLTNQFGIFIRSNAWLGQERDFLENFILVTKKVAYPFLNFKYLPLLEFIICTIVGFILFAVLAVRHKNLGLFLCFFAFFGGNFLIHYINGGTMFRGAQTFCFFIAVVALVLIEQLKSIVALKKPVIVLVALLVLIQTADMNRWFWNDHMRYKKDSFAVHTIAAELVENYDISKPVVFTNGWRSFYNGGFLNTHYMQGGQSNGNSAVYWGAAMLNGDVEVFHQFFRMEGYDFLVMPTQEQIDRVQEESKEMPCYPYKGYIREKEDCIIINMGTFPQE